MSTATFIAPVSAILLGVFALNETLETAHVTGMIAIFGGMLMIDGRILKVISAKSKPKINRTVE